MLICCCGYCRILLFPLNSIPIRMKMKLITGLNVYSPINNRMKRMKRMQCINYVHNIYDISDETFNCFVLFFSSGRMWIQCPLKLAHNHLIKSLTGWYDDSYAASRVFQWIVRDAPHSSFSYFTFLPLCHNFPLFCMTHCCGSQCTRCLIIWSCIGYRVTWIMQ